MCGLSGIFNTDRSPVDLKILKAMNRTMAHRGPDGEGYHLGPVDGAQVNFIGLGHRRLSIIDLVSGDQPMSSIDGSVTVAFNGEIYNFKELKAILVAGGYRFRTNSDTESIIYAYMHWGKAFVRKLRGMFAIALWDSKKEMLLLARDRVGKKPLYYHYDEKRLIFASELKAFGKIPDFSLDTDYKALDAYFSFGYVPSPMSIFNNIRKLEPAHIAICSAKGMNISRYWDLDLNCYNPDIREADAMEGLVALFDESVKIRLVSDVPLGAFLSGGVDSSAVVASMARLNKKKSVKTNSIGFLEERYNELTYARMVSGLYGTEHQESVVEPDILDILQKIIWHFDEPFSDASAIPTWYVSMITADRVKVALSGDGGDENYAGYTNRYKMNRLEDRIRKKIPAPIRHSIIKKMAELYPRADKLPRPLRLKLFLTNLSLSMEDAYFRDMSFYFKEDSKRKLYSSGFKDLLNGYSSFNVLGRFFKRNNNPDAVARAQYVDVKTYMAEDILVKVDRMSMAHSLEVRSPLLDHKLMEFTAGLPSGLKLNRGESKYILKKINEKRLPPDILYRKKQGFCVPLAEWFRKDLKGHVNDMLFDSRSSLKGFVNMDYVKKLWYVHLKGYQDNSPQIWNLLILDLWKRKFDFSKKFP